MTPDTKVFQEMADAMLSLFDNMRPVPVLVEDSEIFHQERAPYAVYEWSNIRINPSYALTCSFDEMQGLICHELIHAWLHRKGLDGLGEFLDDHHNEWFVRKALDINEKKIDRLNVSLDYLLVTPEALDIYHRVAGIPFAHHQLPRVSNVLEDIAAETSELVPTIQLPKIDRFQKVVFFGLPVVVTGLLLNKARLIPGAVASFVWLAWAVSGIVVAALSMFQRRRS